MKLGWDALRTIRRRGETGETGAGISAANHRTALPCAPHLNKPYTELKLILPLYPRSFDFNAWPHRLPERASLCASRAMAVQDRCGLLAVEVTALKSRPPQEKRLPCRKRVTSSGERQDDPSLATPSSEALICTPIVSSGTFPQPARKSKYTRPFSFHQSSTCFCRRRTPPGTCF